MVICYKNYVNSLDILRRESGKRVLRVQSRFVSCCDISFIPVLFFIFMFSCVAKLLFLFRIYTYFIHIPNRTHVECVSASSPVDVPVLELFFEQLCSVGSYFFMVISMSLSFSPPFFLNIMKTSFKKYQTPYFFIFPKPFFFFFFLVVVGILFYRLILWGVKLI